MTEPKEPGTMTDDMDLLDLIDKASRFWKAYKKIIFLFSALGIVLAITFYKIVSPTYTSTLLLHSFLLTNTEEINIVENWNDLLKNGEYTLLSKRLNCDKALVKKITELKANEVQKLYVQNNPNGFTVEASVKDNRILNQLQKGVVYGLENSDYIKSRLTSRRANLVDLIGKVKEEIKKLDSTKSSVEKGITTTASHSSSYIIDISNLNSQTIALNEKLLDYQDQLKFTNAVQVLHDFEPFEKPTSPSLIKYLLLGGISGFAIGYIVATYKHIKKLLVSRNNRRHVVKNRRYKSELEV